MAHKPLAHFDDVRMAEALADALAPLLRDFAGDPPSPIDPVIGSARFAEVLGCALSSVADDFRDDAQARSASMASDQTDLGDVSSPHGDMLDAIASHLIRFNH
jgi:hypothetical protein